MNFMKHAEIPGGLIYITNVYDHRVLFAIIKKGVELRTGRRFIWLFRSAGTSLTLLLMRVEYTHNNYSLSGIHALG
uniref:Uncharacterized protein n=1 Tax=Solanum lycopersicum TaxID=4081 RepID=A0A3Q7FXB9_SOLLC